MAVRQLPAETQREVESFVTDWLSENRIPGASVAITDGDEVVFADGFGARDLDSNAPATADTCYGMASITKSFTAMAVLQQVERGAVALDDHVSDYLTVFEDLPDPPTVHELLSHSSGMPSDGSSVVLIARLTGADPVEVPLSSDADLRRYVADSTPERVEEDRFSYYNTGYTILGKLVAAVDGRKFREYVAEELLDPLEMSRSVVAPADVAALDDAMTPYRTDDGQRVPTDFPVKGVGAAGGLVSTVRDLARYLQFQFDPDEEILPADRLAKAKAPHATRQQFIDGTEQTYGYGWTRRPFLGDDLISHGGSLAVSTAFLGFLADEQVGVAVACNDSPATHPQHVGPALLAILDGRNPAEANRYYGLRRKAEDVAGEYESFRGIQTATVEPDGSNLRIELETALDTQQVAATPETADPDDLQYYTVGEAGARFPVEFERTSEGMDLFFQRWRLHRQD